MRQAFTQNGGLFRIIEKGEAKMGLFENKTIEEIAIGEAYNDSTKLYCDQTEPIIDYLLRHLDIDFLTFTEEHKRLLQKNFIHIICMIIKDLKVIENHIEKYNNELKKMEQDKSNKGEYRKRKIIYFCKINEEARMEIIDFLQTRLKDYLLENRFDTLKREEEADSLTKLFMDRRYSYTHYKDYYDMNFEYGICVKINHLPDIQLKDFLETEGYYLRLKRDNPHQYKMQIRRLVEDKHILQNIVDKISVDYYLHKRKEIFEDMAESFARKNYQTFLTLGLLQVEGMFYDWCQIKFGDKENMGTLVEKVQKSLYGGNGYKFMKYYPYFAFDVPIMRNEIAHKGIMECADLEEAAYNLILDLNAVSSMVREESFKKFQIFIITHQEMIKLHLGYSNNTELEREVNKKLILELMQNSVLANDDFWEILKSPLDYEDELRFYAKDNLPEGYVDLPQIVFSISAMLEKESFWRALYDDVNDYLEEDGIIPETLLNFVRKMKNEYIAHLTEDAKKACIELAKTISQQID